MRRTIQIALVCLPFLAAAGPGLAGEVEAHGVFDDLKSLAGTWRGEPEGEGEAAGEEHMGEVVHEIRVSAAGTVVMETMGPGTEHEMINMYHLDGDDLMLTHYCAAGNQPIMRLDRQRSTPSKLVFDFAGGTNMDPAADHHIHSATITLIDGEHVESVWIPYSGGKQVGKMTFHLARSR